MANILQNCFEVLADGNNHDDTKCGKKKLAKNGLTDATVVVVVRHLLVSLAVVELGRETVESELLRLHSRVTFFRTSFSNF